MLLNGGGAPSTDATPEELVATAVVEEVDVDAAEPAADEPAAAPLPGTGESNAGCLHDAALHASLLGKERFSWQASGGRVLLPNASTCGVRSPASSIDN